MMSPADLATLSLPDPDQGVCPNGHPCELDRVVGRRTCRTRGYRGLALICWETTANHIDLAARAGADPILISSARLFLADRERPIP
jgi:hypothetical protein